MKKLIIISLVVGLILLGFGSINSPRVVFAQKLPENFEDLKGIWKGLWDRFIQGLKGAWEKAVEIWKKMIDWIENIWKSYIFPFFESIWRKIWNFFLEKILEKIKGLMK
jgi:predicted PurR-regulated permease PerM